MEMDKLIKSVKTWKKMGIDIMVKKASKTRELFYEDPYIREFEAQVVEITGREVVLDQTAFYPAGGGQPGDTGFIADSKVINTIRKDGKIIHILDEEPRFSVGDRVFCKLDWQKRYIIMRSHTAEHIISRILILKFGDIEFAGTQFGEKRSRIDVRNLPVLSDEQLCEIEEEANAIVRENYPVKTFVLKREDAEKYLSKYKPASYLIPPSVQDVRIVEIDDFDAWACGGTHVRSTGEIGYIDILTCKKVGKNTVRIYFTIRDEGSREKRARKKIVLLRPRGTRDFLPDEMMIREEVIEKIKSVFEAYGFLPLETPAIERGEILAAKGAGGPEILKEAYLFTDKGGRTIGLRYDLTVPLARVIAMNPGLPLPFKRYQIGKVWRYGDVAKGRYREFWTADVDIVGSDSMLADAEIIACTIDVFSSLGFEDFVVRLNNRKVLNALIKYVGVELDRAIDVLRTIDKLDKIGREGVREELKQKGISEDIINRIMDLISIRGEPEEVLAKLKEMLKGVGEGEEGIRELEEILHYLEEMGVKSRIKIDLSLARGLDYYTGPIFEVSAGDKIGSLAGGGRYDDMIGLFAGRKIPAVGVGIGVDRIIDVMKERGMISEKYKRMVLVAYVNEKHIDKALQIAQLLRRNRIPTIIDLRKRNLKRQLKYANVLNIPFVVIIGAKELEQGVVKLRDMMERAEEDIEISQLPSVLKKKLEQI